MKKKLLSVAMVAVMSVFIFVGGKTAASENTVNIDDIKSATAASPGDFSILDVTPAMIESGIYAVAPDGTENVISLFTGPDGLSYVCAMIVSPDGTGDLVCGSYTAANVTTATRDGIDWATVNFIDVYTGTSCTVIFADYANGTVMISNDDYSYKIAGTYLTADDTINYMGAAINFIS